jgi:tRNA(adenine34) deaminase
MTPSLNTDSVEVHEYWMQIALSEAKKAAACGEVPIGAVLVDMESNQQIASSYNQPISKSDPTAHAEIEVLRKASQLRNNYRLPGTSLYVTIEPCTMCAGALIHARVDTVIFGAREPRAGALVSQLQLGNAGYFNHRIQVVEAVLGNQCSDLLRAFFRSKRQ